MEMAAVGTNTAASHVPPVPSRQNLELTVKDNKAASQLSNETHKTWISSPRDKPLEGQSPCAPFHTYNTSTPTCSMLEQPRPRLQGRHSVGNQSRRKQVLKAALFMRGMLSARMQRQVVSTGDLDLERVGMGRGSLRNPQYRAVCSMSAGRVEWRREKHWYGSSTVVTDEDNWATSPEGSGGEGTKTRRKDQNSDSSDHLSHGFQALCSPMALGTTPYDSSKVGIEDESLQCYQICEVKRMSLTKVSRVQSIDLASHQHRSTPVLRNAKQAKVQQAKEIAEENALQANAADTSPAITPRQMIMASAGSKGWIEFLSLLSESEKVVLLKTGQEAKDRRDYELVMSI